MVGCSGLRDVLVHPVKIAAVLLSVLLAGCGHSVPAVDDTVAGMPDSLPATTPIPVVESIVAGQPLPSAVEDAAGAISGPLVAAQEALSPGSAALPRPDSREMACRRVAASLIIRWEVSSPSFYRKKLDRPIWPGGASGVTWGIGYDGGQMTRAVILDDWQGHIAVQRLAKTAGISGESAHVILSQYRDIPTSFEYASRVFEDRSLIQYYRQSARAFRNGFADLRTNACGSMLSLVYNRGTSMTGDSRREMRALRDYAIPHQDYAAIAVQLRSMVRLWRGTVNENGLRARREAEAILVETP